MRINWFATGLEGYSPKNWQISPLNFKVIRTCPHRLKYTTSMWDCKTAGHASDNIVAEKN